LRRDEVLAQFLPSGLCQFDGDNGSVGDVGFVGVMGFHRAASSEMFPCELDGGEVTTLAAPDGGTGHVRRDAEKTPLLAMLTPPSES
jgi:hypothetical protein